MDIVSREANNLRPPASVTSVGMDHWQGITLHHTGGPADQPLDQVQQAALNQGLVDTHYTLFVRGGRVHMGRGLSARPAGDKVNVNVQICMPGTWASSLPPAGDLKTLVELILWLDSEIGRPVSQTIVGHRDVPGNATACPGDALHRWMHNDLPVLLDGTGSPSPKPDPKPGVRPAPGPPVTFPLPDGHYFGPAEWGNESVSGRYERHFRGRRDRSWLQEWTRQLERRGWPVGQGRRYLRQWGADGIYGPEYAELILAFQHDQRLAGDSLLGVITWDAAYHNPVT